jgi:acyl-CoA dehydrogenase
VNLTPTAEEDRFRERARSWLAAHASPRRQGDFARLEAGDQAAYVADCRRWQATLLAGGWAGISWPSAYGGQGGTLLEEYLFAQEQARFNVPTGALEVGLGMVGPAVLAHGTDRQRGEYLPALLKGEAIWCQLFSEPGAGSDLAAVAIRATPDGEDWLISGQKVWTSWARHSDFGILLARSAPERPKHRGITCFLVDMRSPGIVIRPLRQMTGDAHFNEVFFDDVRIPGSAVLGDVHAGWAVAMTVLSGERGLVGAEWPGFADIVELARSRGLMDDPLVRQEAAGVYIREEVLRCWQLRLQTALAHGRDPGPVPSAINLTLASHLRASAELGLSLQGPSGVLAQEMAGASGVWQRQFLEAPSVRIASGTDEIQRTVIGERTLGLPAEPRSDKNVAFRDLEGVRT